MGLPTRKLAIDATRSRPVSTSERPERAHSVVVRRAAYPPSAESPLHVLLLEQDASDAELFRTLLSRAFPTGFTVEVRHDLRSGLEKLRSDAFDCVCVDLRLPDAMGAQCVADLLSESPGLAIVVLTSDDNDELAMAAVRTGAEDCLVKGMASGSQIGHALRYACERKRNQAELASAAKQDSLTGLSNRRHFEDRLSRALAHEASRGSVSVLLIDLDDFKPINDNFGHATGDAFLTELSRRMTASIRDSDLCARLGGDEFAILVTRIHEAQDVHEIAERVRNALCGAVHLSGLTLSTTASIGVATNIDEITVGELLDAADAAMYQAKRGGGNQVQFASVMSTRRPSVPAPTDSYYLVYQPVVSRNGEVISQEGFLRCSHQETPLLTAATLVPKLNRLGFLDEISQSVWQRACTSWTHHQTARQAPHGTVSFNIAPAQALCPDLGNLLSRLVGSHGLRNQDVELEFHVDARMRSQPDLFERLSKLAAAGFGLVLDDFSEEHVSLLRELPVVGVKLSEQLQTESVSSARGQRYLWGLVGMCHALEVWVGATKVESSLQFEALFDAGCDRFQGYYIAKPHSVPSWQVRVPSGQIPALELAKSG